MKIFYMIILIIGQVMFALQFERIFPEITGEVTEIKQGALQGVDHYGYFFVTPDSGIVYYRTWDELKCYAVPDEFGGLPIVSADCIGDDKVTDRIFCATGFGSESDAVYEFNTLTQEFTRKLYTGRPNFVKYLSSGFYFGSEWALKHSPDGESLQNISYFTNYDVKGIVEASGGRLLISAKKIGESTSVIVMKNGEDYYEFDTGYPDINCIHYRKSGTYEEVLVVLGTGSYSDGLYRVIFNDTEITGIELVSLFHNAEFVHSYSGYYFVTIKDSSDLFAVSYDGEDVVKIEHGLDISRITCFRAQYDLYTPNFLVGTDKGVYIVTGTVGIEEPEIPAQFDLRDYNGENYVTSVKSQQGGTCWTFATMASMESNLLFTKEWSWNSESGEPDLAEYHLDWWNGFNQFNNDDIYPETGEGLEVHMGGDYLVAAAYLTRGEGAVRNEDGQSYDYPPDRYPGFMHAKYFPYRIEWYDIDDELNGIEIIKEKIMTHGAIGSCMAYSSSFINQQFIHYQPSSSEEEPNHAVAIIGWDDFKLTQAPEGSGAWLAKNSWGTDWGHDGYFWISYYDKHACKHPEMGAVSFQEVRAFDHTSNSQNVLYHDYHGWRDTMKDCTEAFNVFYMDSWDGIDHVSFYAADDNVDYTVTIYDSFEDGELKNPFKTVSGTIAHRGFHTVAFDYGFGSYCPGDIYVYLYLSKGGQPYDRTSEVPVLLGSKYKTLVRSTADYGESFYHDGEKWIDLQEYRGDDYPGTSNFCIKVNYWIPCGIEDTSIPSSTALHQNYPNPFNPATSIRYALSHDADVKLTVFDITGREVAELVSGRQAKGNYSVNFNAEGLSSGIYFYRLSVDGKVFQSRKMMILK